MHKNICLFLSLLFISFAYTAYSADLSLSVLPINSSSGVSRSELDTVTEYLESALIQTGRFDIVASDQRAEILNEQKFSLGGCSDQSCAIEAGKLLSAQYMVFGTINKQGNSYIFSVKRVNVETSRIDENAIETLLSLTPSQIEQTTLQLAYKIAGLEFNSKDEQIQSYTGRIKIDVNTYGAEAIFNLNQKITNFPVVLDDIPVGEYPLRVYKDGYNTELLSLKVEKGKQTEISVKLMEDVSRSITPVAGTGFVNVFSSPPGMQVEIDHEILDGITPIVNYPLTTGEHFIVVGDFYNSFYQDKETWIMVNEGDVTELPVSLERNHGVIMIHCNIENAVVYINGKKEGNIKNGMALFRNIPTGQIEIVLDKDRYYRETQEIELRPGRTTEINFKLSPEPVKIIFDSNPQSAEVYFDGNFIGKTPTFIENVTQGEHKYYYNYNNYRTEIIRVDIEGINDKTIISELSAPLKIILNDNSDREAEVYMDEVFRGETQAGELHIEDASFGEHNIKIKKPGYYQVSEEITIKELGLKRNYDLKLEDVKYSIITEPGEAEVLIDGELLSNLTPLSIGLSEGTHELTIRKKGYLPVSETINVTDPSGGRIKKSLLEGEDADVLLSWYIREMQKIENNNAGIQQCSSIIDQINKFEKEVEGFNVNIEMISSYFKFYKNYYLRRLEYMESAGEMLRYHIDELDAEKNKIEKNISVLWGAEIASVLVTSGAGVGGYFAFNEMYNNNNADDLIEIVAYSAVGTAVAGFLSSILIPSVGMNLANKNLDEINDLINMCSAELARLEITRSMEREFYTKSDNWKKVAEEISLTEYCSEISISNKDDYPADIYIDDCYVGTTPLSLNLIEGKYNINLKAIKEGRELVAGDDVYIVPGNDLSRSYSLKPTANQKILDDNMEYFDRGESIVKFNTNNVIGYFNGSEIEQHKGNEYFNIHPGANIFQIGEDFACMWINPEEMLRIDFLPMLSVSNINNMPGWQDEPPEPEYAESKNIIKFNVLNALGMGGASFITVGPLITAAVSYGINDDYVDFPTLLIGDLIVSSTIGIIWGFISGDKETKVDYKIVENNNRLRSEWQNTVNIIRTSNDKLKVEYISEIEDKNKTRPLIDVHNILTDEKYTINQGENYIDEWQSQVRRATTAYNKDDYIHAVPAFEEAIKSGCIEGVVWYRYAYSLEQINGLNDDVRRVFYASGKLLQEQDPNNDYIASVEKRLN